MFIRSKVFFLILFIPFIPVLISAQDFKTVADGIEYAEVIRGTEKEPIHINLLRLDLRKVRLDVVHALDAAIGVEKTSSIASRHGAFAAINAGFFKMDGLFKGDAAGILQIDGRLMSESYADRISMMITNGPRSTQVVFGHLNASLSLMIGKEIRYPLGINRQLTNDDIVVLTPDFGVAVSDMPEIEDFVFSKCLPVCEKVLLSSSDGSIDIPKDGFIVRLNKDKRSRLYEYLTGSFQQYGKVSLEKTINRVGSPSDKYLAGVEDIVAGVPQLIKNGRIDITWEQEKTTKEFVETHHPRTAVAKLKDGKFLMVTVDGRQPAYSNGMSLPMLAEFLLQLGATDAMNLDGGGSTTMYLDGKVMNKPSDKEGERAVSDAILVFPRKK